MDITNDMADEREDDSGIESSVPDNLENGVYIRIAINDLKIQVMGNLLVFAIDSLRHCQSVLPHRTLSTDVAINYQYVWYISIWPFQSIIDMDYSISIIKFLAFNCPVMSYQFDVVSHTYKMYLNKIIFKSPFPKVSELIHCGLFTSYGDIDIGQH